MANMPGRGGVFVGWLPSVACHCNCEPSMRNPPRYRGRAEAASQAHCQIRERENGEHDGGVDEWLRGGIDSPLACGRPKRGRVDRTDRPGGARDGGGTQFAHQRRTAITCLLIEWVGSQGWYRWFVEMRLMRHVIFEWEVMNEWKRRHIKRILVFLADVIQLRRHMRNSVEIEGFDSRVQAMPLSRLFFGIEEAFLPGLRLQ